MRAERGQLQQHMKHSRMAKRGHKEGKKRAKPETVRMPKRSPTLLSIYKVALVPEGYLSVPEGYLYKG